MRVINIKAELKNNSLNKQIRIICKRKMEKQNFLLRVKSIN